MGDSWKAIPEVTAGTMLLLLSIRMQQNFSASHWGRMDLHVRRGGYHSRTIILGSSFSSWLLLQINILSHNDVWSIINKREVLNWQVERMLTMKFITWCKPFLVTRTVKNLSAMQETQVDPWVGKILWRREWLPTAAFLPEEFHGQRAWQSTVHGITKNQTGLND